MPYQIRKSKNDRSMIRFGPLIRADSDVPYALFHMRGFTDETEQTPREPLKVSQSTVPKKGKLKFDLTEGEPYMLFIGPGKTTAGVNTREALLRAPFYIRIDSPAKPAPQPAGPQPAKSDKLALAMRRATGRRR